MFELVLTLAALSGAQAQSDTARPAISLNAADGSTSFSGLPTPLAGTVFDAGGMGTVAVLLRRNHIGTVEDWNGSNWTSNGYYWQAKVAPSAVAGDYNWSADIAWPTGDKLPRGVYTFHVIAWDNVNNRSDILRTVTIGAPDTTAPAVAISSPAHGELIDNAQRGLTTLTGTVSDGAGAGVGYVDVYLVHMWSQQSRWWNGVSWGGWAKLATTLSAPDAQGNQVWSVSVPLPSAEQLATGQYYLDALAYDRSGNGAFDRHVFNVTPFDGTPPTANVTFPAEGQQLTNLPAIRGTSSDIGSGVSRVDVHLVRHVLQSDGSEVWSAWKGDHWVAEASGETVLPGSDSDVAAWTRNQSLPTGAALPTGTYVVMIQVFDRYNNVGMSFRNFSIVPVPPLSIDAHIRADSAGAWLGEGFSNADAQGQTLSGTIQSGQTQTRFVRIKMNGGDASKTVRVSIPDWAAFAAAGWTAHFFDAPQGAPQGGSEITEQITGASGWTTAMSDGNERQIRVEMVAPTNIEAGATRALTFRVEADPTSETSALDVVKATWNTVAPTPDLSIRVGNNNGVWLGADVHNQDGAGQTIERVAAPGHVVRGEIQLSVADAANGQIVRWSVPDWDAFRANGWDAKFFDAPGGGNDVTGQITGEGWTTRHTNGYQKVIGFEVTVPENATDVTRVLSVRAQVAGGAADVVKAKIRVLPNVRPDVAISALDKNGLPADWVGEGELSPTEQRIGKVWGAGETLNFAVKIKNTSNQAAQFALSWPDLPNGWELKLTDALEEGALLEGEIVTPSIEPFQSITWRAEVKANAPAQLASLPIRVSGATLFDEVKIDADLQSLLDVEWSADGQSWDSVANTTPPKAKWKQVVGLRAVKSNPGAPWPDSQPSGPVWKWGSVKAIGDTAWVASVDTDGDTGRQVSASLLGQSKVVTLYALPDLNLSLTASAKHLLAGTTASSLQTTELSVAILSDNLVPVGSNKIRLQAISESAQSAGTWNGSATPYLDIAVGAGSTAKAIWTSGAEEGQIKFVATVLDENDQPSKVSDVTYAQTHKPYALLKTGTWREENGVWSRTVTASTRFMGEKLGGVGIAFSTQINDYETQQPAQGWENAAPFDVAAGVTDAAGNFSTVQRWNPVEAGAWPHDYEVKAEVELR